MIKTNHNNNSILVGKNLNADYAILVLEKHITTNNIIKIAKLPQRDAKCPPGNNLVVSGWGADYTSDRPTNKLWAVLQTCLPIDRCPSLGDERDKYTFCAGNLKNETNTICFGDSGGNTFDCIIIEVNSSHVTIMSEMLFNSSNIFKPCTGPLTYTDHKTGETTLYGVVAHHGDFSKPCLSTARYARVAEPSVLDWIKKHTDAA